MAKPVKIGIKSVNKFQKGINGAISGLKRLGALSKRIGSGMLTFAKFAAIGLLGIGIAAIKTASDVREMESKFIAVFRELSKATEKWAGDVATATSRSKSDIMGWLAVLQDTFVPLGFARDKAAEFAKQLVRLTLDLASFNNKAEPDVLADLQTTLVGNTEAVRKYGIIITEAAVKQEAVNAGFAKTKKSVSEAAKVQARLNLIIKGSTDAQGDAERTSGSFANRIRGLMAAFKEFRVELGGQIIDGSKLGEVIQRITGGVNTLAQRLTKSKIIEVFAAGAVRELEKVKIIMDAIFAGGKKRKIAIEGLKDLGKNLAERAGNQLLKFAPLIGDVIGRSARAALFGFAGAAGRRSAAQKTVAGEQRTILGRIGAQSFGTFLGFGPHSAAVSAKSEEFRQFNLQAEGVRLAGATAAKSTQEIVDAIQTQTTDIVEVP